MVYVLELQNNKFYIGHTLPHLFKQRKGRHFAGKGAKWTRLHKPLRVIEVQDGDIAFENTKTIEYMLKYGWENVRGGGWCQVNLEFPPPPLFSYFCPWSNNPIPPSHYGQATGWSRRGAKPGLGCDDPLAGRRSH